MGFFDDLFGGTARKEAKRANRLRIDNQERALDELDLFGESMRDLLGSFDTQAGALQGRFDDLFGLSSPGLLSGIRTRANSLFSGTDPTAILQSALSGVNQSEQAALAANDRTFQDAIRTGTADIARSLNRRGLLNSTGLESQITAGLLPNAIGGRLAADAATRGAFSNLRANTSLGAANALNASRSAGAGLLGTSAGLQSDILARAFGLDADLFNQRFGLEQAPVTFRADRLVQPNAIFREQVINASTPPIIDIFGNVAGQIAGSLLP